VQICMTTLGNFMQICEFAQLLSVDYFVQTCTIFPVTWGPMRMGHFCSSNLFESLGGNNLFFQWDLKSVGRKMGS